MSIIVFFAVCLVPALFGLGIWYISSPFHFPYFTHTFDVTGKRNVRIGDLLDNFMIDGDFGCVEIHEETIRDWMAACEAYLSTCLFAKHRRKQYEACLDLNRAYQFQVSRTQTRYKQVNYQRYPYKVEQTELEACYSYSKLKERFDRLHAIGFACTLRNYEEKNQRKLMTKTLRKQIMERDHYTCQICGKYMPDEVGLHIDHIVPVVKGGKSIASNLQVLCSKCNGKKGGR